MFCLKPNSISITGLLLERDLVKAYVPRDGLWIRAVMLIMRRGSLPTSPSLAFKHLFSVTFNTLVNLRLSSRFESFTQWFDIPLKEASGVPSSNGSGVLTSNQRCLRVK
ncbi:hypothetical protein TNIN_362001 [Trichonephila inaurata madagascariensis]|uniref:Uncharacterized protein n=1 Tax=Trichonephila inaurata madagascariensis TaxID=2747483 RepID=A0A8X6XH93_9ARAC|nr:hypothetical protein TNIN_362001 [Trichonephila inaurata madagascariensis]